MASFDIMAACRYGYAYVWNHRPLIFRLAAIPVFIKVISYFFILGTGLDNNLLRQGLILFPAYLLEGYMVCVIVRLAIFTHEPLIQPPGSAANDYYRQRGRDIQAGAVIYALIKLLASLAVGLVFLYAPETAGQGQAQPEASISSFLAASAFIIVAIWAFRIIWINITVTLGFTMKSYMKRIRGYSFSFHLFSAWIICLLPLWLLAMIIGDLMVGLTGHSADNPVQAYRFFMVAVQSICETCIIIIASIAIGKGVYAVMTGKPIEKK